MQRGASISHFFNPSELKRPIFTSCKIRSGGLPAAQSSVARALFCLAPSSGLVAAFVFLSPSLVDGSCAEKRFVYLTSWDLGREGCLRAAVLHAKVAPGTAKTWSSFLHYMSNCGAALIATPTVLQIHLSIFIVKS